MGRSTSASQTFESPISDTWATLVAIERYPETTSSYVAIEPLTDTLRGLGARWEQTRIVWGREHAQTMEVVEWEPLTSLTLRAEEAGASYETRYVLTEVSNGTRVDATFHVTPTNLFGRLVMRIMGRKLVRSAGEAMQQILAELSSASDPSRG